MGEQSSIFTLVLRALLPVHAELCFVRRGTSTGFDSVACAGFGAIEVKGRECDDAMID
jgi:hypothetical protein